MESFEKFMTPETPCSGVVNGRDLDLVEAFDGAMKMNLTQIFEVLSPLVYIRRGELIVQFGTPTDLVGRVAELSSVLTLLDQETRRRGDTRVRSKQLPRVAGTGSARGQVESEPCAVHRFDSQASVKPGARCLHDGGSARACQQTNGINQAYVL